MSGGYWRLLGLLSKSDIKRLACGSDIVEKAISSQVKQELDDFVDYATAWGLNFNGVDLFEVEDEAAFKLVFVHLIRLEKRDGSKFFGYSSRAKESFSSEFYNNIIKKARREMLLTQADVARKIGITMQQYSLIENGKSFKIETITNICKLLNISIKIPDNVS